MRLVQKLLVALAVVAAACLVLNAVLRTRRSGEGFLGLGASEDETIFVSVASFRDDECNRTIKEMFNMAARPERVYVGTCEQNRLDDQKVADKESCVDRNFKWASHVRRIVVPHTEAGGPTTARYFCSLLYRNEKYFMQIDSHSEFVKNWDTLVIRQLKELPRPEKSVLTGYPRSRTDSKSHPGVAVMCKSSFQHNGVPTFEAAILDAKGKHFPVAFLAGGFMFSHGLLLREVEFDPSLIGLFAGEEITYSARAWTAGYDFYAPNRNILYHHYGRPNQPKFWSLPNKSELQAKQRAAVEKIKQILAGKMSGYRYGLGTARTIDAYNAFAGLDWENRKTTSFDKFCAAPTRGMTPSRRPSPPPRRRRGRN